MATYINEDDDMMMLRRTGCSCSMHCILITAVVIWSSIFFYLSLSLYGLQSKGKGINEQQTLALNYEQALLDLAELKHENEKLRKLLKSGNILDRKKLIVAKKNDSMISNEFKKKKESVDRGKDETLVLSPPNGFSMKHEISRRELHNSIWELYYYLNSQLLSTYSNNSVFINHTRNQLLSLLGQAAAFKNVDSAESWRTNALANISAMFQNHFDKMQNPDDCKAARHVVTAKNEYSCETAIIALLINTLAFRVFVISIRQSPVMIRYFMHYFLILPKTFETLGKICRILTCDLNKQCGFGCQLHHVAYCFIVAYGSNRTLVLTNDGNTWNYASNGWTAAFLPITKCLFSKIFKPNEYSEDWGIGKHYENKRILKLPIIDSLADRPPYLPLVIPQSYSDELLKLHSNAPAFFISQFIRYLMRPSAVMAKKIDQAVKKVPFDKGPIVGLQIRRTDKINTEAAFHDLDEYMKWTEDWFRIEEYRTQSSIKRRIYIATDDPEVFDEVAMKYPHYEIYGDQKVAKMAQVHSRYTMESLIGIIIDIELLSRPFFSLICYYCLDFRGVYLVCTFSSQVCRMGYELMQVRFGDAGDRFHSLDDIYYFGGQQAHEQIAVESYSAENDNEIDLKTGDVIGIAGNHWDGFSKGTNRRTGKNGLYPSYKAREKYIILDFP
uniref:GT23 domain-containing protein n=1 Tax=Elaeophora elaphi TaxID=1147741 RepID=A0A0R3S004_9BILA